MARPERLVRRAPLQPRLPAAAGRGVRRRAHGARRPWSAPPRCTAPLGMRPLIAAPARSTASSPTACSRRSGARRCGSSHDDVATVAEVDDAIRFGAGLRWAFMGSFLTYRIAGGEAGMRHFMAQFGPALQWPWTKLTDVPELTDELLDKLVAQSDEQAAGRSIRELERLRDDCLVAILQGLRTRDAGAGAVLERLRARRCSTATPAVHGRRRGAAAAARHRRRAGVGRLQRPRPREPLPAGVRRRDRRPAAPRRRRRRYLEAGGSYFTVETHLALLAEARAERARCSSTTQVLGPRREAAAPLPRAAARAPTTSELATAEQMLLHVDTERRPRARPRPRCWPGSRGSPRRTPRCHGPRRRAARSRCRARAGSDGPALRKRSNVERRRARRPAGELEARQVHGPGRELGRLAVDQHGAKCGEQRDGDSKNHKLPIPGARCRVTLRRQEFRQVALAEYRRPGCRLTSLEEGARLGHLLGMSVSISRRVK